ncbi:hypothetical protein [Psychrobacillus sp. NPDC096389]|uniref:hypothetical protein n=1 Tax=Psychrobacillus sp. NPDC096389 TaxID=3364490 RepID=UPI003811FC5C
MSALFGMLLGYLSLSSNRDEKVKTDAAENAVVRTKFIKLDKVWILLEVIKGSFIILKRIILLIVTSITLIILTACARFKLQLRLSKTFNLLSMSHNIVV